jgi:hypothetical protein
MDYRFSPIKSKSELEQAINYVHTECHKLCKQIIGEYLSVAGDVGVFCHFEDEYELLTNFREELTKPSDNPNQKYFQLLDPIVVAESDGVPAAMYEWLYIRVPNTDSPQVGDMDFVLSKFKYSELKQSVQKGGIEGASIYERPGWDMIELKTANSDVLPYVCTKEMAEKVRVRF